MNTLHIGPVRAWRYNAERRRYLGKKGVLLHFSVVRVGPIGLTDRTPYVVGMIKIGKDVVIAQIVDCDSTLLKPGLRLCGRLRRLFNVNPDGIIIYGVKFVPDEY